MQNRKIKSHTHEDPVVHVRAQWIMETLKSPSMHHEHEWTNKLTFIYGAWKLPYKNPHVHSAMKNTSMKHSQSAQGWTMLLYIKAKGGNSSVGSAPQWKSQMQYWRGFKSPVWHGIFSQRVNSLMVSVQPPCAITCTATCTRHKSHMLAAMPLFGHKNTAHTDMTE